MMDYTQAASSYGKLLALSYRLLGNYADAEDAVQEGLLKAYRNLHTFKGRSSLDTWLCTIVKNCARSRYRRRQSSARHELPYSPEDNESARSIEYPAPASSRPDVICEQAEAQKQLEKALNRLPQDQKEALLSVADGMKYREIAERINVPRATVATRVHRARKELRAALGLQAAGA
ncbi:MAG: RNA polymerase sigma factor [Candidatus Aenigmarchaeota archaeon]|nr:RNA polymerase sigma factor [Candidatus Aenigmarchaeota archaeon]